MAGESNPLLAAMQRIPSTISSGGVAFQHPAELRRRTCERLLAGEAVKDLVAELAISAHTLYRWRRQALIDAGQSPRAKSYEADPLLAARRRVKELEAELKLVKAASALFEGGGDVSPKAGTRLSEG